MSTALENLKRLVRGESPPPPIFVLLGCKLTWIERGEAVVEMEASERHANPMGTLHGGILCDLTDAAMGMAYVSELEEGESFTTLEIKINFLRPVWKSHLRAEGKVIKRGRTIGLAQAQVTDGEGQLVAWASSTCMTLRGEQSKGR